MLSYIFRYAFIALLVFGAACKKQTVVQSDFATLLMYGWTPDGSVIVTNFKEGPLAKYSEAARINSYYRSVYMNKYYTSEAIQPLSFYAFPDTFPQSKPVLKLDLELKKGNIYSLFLGGTPSSLDTMLIHENFPVLKTSDSIGAFRFLNLVKGDPVSINLVGEPSGSLAQNISYMQITGFINLPVAASVTQYQVEVRDAATDELLITSTLRYSTNAEDLHRHWLARLHTYAFVGIHGDVSNTSNRMRLNGFQHN